MVVHTHSYKKIDHKKYVKGKVDLLSDIVAPLLAALHAVTENNTIRHQFLFSYAPVQLYDTLQQLRL